MLRGTVLAPEEALVREKLNKVLSISFDTDRLFRRQSIVKNKSADKH